MNEIIKRNAGLIGLFSTGAFLAVLWQYIYGQTIAYQSEIVTAVGLLAIVVNLCVLYLLQAKTKGTKKVVKKTSKAKKGFTLIEVLLVVAILAILAGIVIIAVNPTKQLGDARNTQRRADVNTIINAVYQYSIDNNGSLPTTTPVITTTPTIACSTTGATCTSSSYVDLGQLTTNGKYLVSIPKDPSNPAAPSSGYNVSKDANNRVTVSAPSAENSVTISVTR